MIERSQHLPFDPHHDNPHDIDETPTDELDAVYHPDIRQKEEPHHTNHHPEKENHHLHKAENNMAHLKHIQTPLKNVLNDDNTEASSHDDKMTSKLVELLQQYNSERRTTTTEAISKANGESDEIDQWLDEILQITADDSEILSAALELYADGPPVIKPKHKTPVSTEMTEPKLPFRLSHGFLKKHKAKHPKWWKSTGNPTFHVKGRKYGMTFKRIMKENSTDTYGSEAIIQDDNSTEIYSTATEEGTTLITNTFESAIEAKILDYVMHNVSLTAEQTKEVKKETGGNKTLIDKMVETKVSVNWLIIGVCITFSLTCICALIVGIVTVITRKRRFSADVWWNQKDQFDEEQAWLGSKSDDDLELGANSKFQHLYSLQGDELKTQVSRMVHDAGSSSTSTSSSLK